MNITQTRKWLEKDRTISELTIDGYLEKLFVCEDVVRGNGDPKTVSQWKVKGASAIPYGTYDVQWTYSQRFGCETYQLMNVPGFDGIRVHSGNTEKDTEGCLLPGMSYRVGYGVLNSKEALNI